MIGLRECNNHHEDLPVPSPVVFLLENTALLHLVVELLIIDLGIVVSLQFGVKRLLLPSGQ